MQSNSNHEIASESAWLHSPDEHILHLQTNSPCNSSNMCSQTKHINTVFDRDTFDLYSDMDLNPCTGTDGFVLQEKHNQHDLED